MVLRELHARPCAVRRGTLLGEEDLQTSWAEVDPGEELRAGLGNCWVKSDRNPSGLGPQEGPRGGGKERAGSSLDCPVPKHPHHGSAATGEPRVPLPHAVPRLAFCVLASVPGTTGLSLLLPAAASRMIANSLNRDSPPGTPPRRPDTSASKISVTVSNKMAAKSAKAAGEGLGQTAGGAGHERGLADGTWGSRSKHHRVL